MFFLCGLCVANFNHYFLKTLNSFSFKLCKYNLYNTSTNVAEGFQGYTCGEGLQAYHK